MKSKLTTKDVIAAGAFAAIYLVLLTVLAVMVLPIVPVLYLATPLIAGVLLGTVYMLYCVTVSYTHLDVNCIFCCGICALYSAA